MGLEVVEFIIAAEKAFGFSIPDRDVRGLRSPRDFVAYLCRRVSEVDSSFGSPGARWTKAEIEQVVDGLLAKATGRSDVPLDDDFKNIFS